MKSHTSLVAQQTHLSEWAELVRDFHNRPQGMKIDEWCQLHDITKASYEKCFRLQGSNFRLGGIASIPDDKLENLKIGFSALFLPRNVKFL